MGLGFLLGLSPSGKSLTSKTDSNRASRGNSLMSREVNYMAELPFKQDTHFEKGAVTKKVFHYGNGFLFEEVPHKNHIILYYNSERKNFYFKGNFLEKDDLSEFKGTMHFKKDDQCLGDIKIIKLDDDKLQFFLDGVEHDKPSKVMMVFL
jgi:hypothetical protein